MTAFDPSHLNFRRCVLFAAIAMYLIVVGGVLL